MPSEGRLDRPSRIWTGETGKKAVIGAESRKRQERYFETVEDLTADA
jgi:hypothetical protein